MIQIIRTVAIAFALLLALRFGAAADCAIETANQGIAYKTQSPGIVGIAPRGFVIPNDKRPVVNGIDVSRWQEDVDFSKVRQCGGSFAYVRLSAGQSPENELRGRSLWGIARSNGLMVGGYHSLMLIDPEKPYSKL